MKVQIILNVEDEDADPGHDTGVTEEAFERLLDALGEAGFEIDSGPVKAE